MFRPAEAPLQPRVTDRLRPLRYLLRAPLLSLHVLIALLVALLVGSRLAGRLRVGSRSLEDVLIRWWSTRLLHIFGFRIRASGRPLPGAVLLVANHVSWLDIMLIYSQRTVTFVAKSEIDRWPLVGWLVASAGTIFHRRGSTDSLQRVMTLMVERLRAGRPVGVFPEGGSGRGLHVGVFHARIFQVALDAQVPVQPVALRYGIHGVADPRVPFGAGEKFLPNFLRLLGGPRREAEAHFLEPVPPSPDARRRMADESRARIAAVLGDH